MRGLLIKDFLLIKKSLSFVYIFPLLVILVCGGANIVYLLPMLAMIIPVFFGFFVNNTLYSDDVSQWGRYAKALPLSLNTTVLEKYLLGLISIFCGTVLAFAVCSILAIITTVEFGYVYLLVYLGFFMSLTYISVLIPSVYKFGVSKGPVVFIGLISMMIVVPFALDGFNVSIDWTTFIDNPWVFIPVSLACLIVIYLLSFKITISILKFV